MHCSNFLRYQDNQPPQIRCPHDVTGNTDPGKATKRVEWRQPLATDNVDRLPTVVSSPGNIVSPYKFSIGATRITYTATDDSGNSQSCVFTVTITGENSIDLQSPILHSEFLSGFTSAYFGAA